MTTRIWITALIYPMASAVLFGLGLIPILTIPALVDSAATLLPFAVALSFVGAAPVAWLIAGHIRRRRSADASRKGG